MIAFPYGLPPPGFRLPDTTHVGAVQLQVADLPRSIDYYQHALGLRVSERTASAATLTDGDGTRALVRLAEKRGVVPATRAANGLFHFALLLPARDHLGRFLRHLDAQHVPWGASDHRVSEALYLRDPDGLGIEVYADRPRASWASRDRELTMTTEPLDVVALVRAGGESPWTGAPAGTTMGHMHLHVGDLERARGFYHGALGFDVTAWSYPGALFFSAGGYHHHLGTNTWGSGDNADDGCARLLSWDLHVPDAAGEAAASLQSAGYSAEQMGDDWAVSDPWGTRLILRSR